MAFFLHGLPHPFRRLLLINALLDLPDLNYRPNPPIGSSVPMIAVVFAADETCESNDEDFVNTPDAPQALM